MNLRRRGLYNVEGGSVKNAGSDPPVMSAAEPRDLPFANIVATALDAIRVAVWRPFLAWIATANAKGAGRLPKPIFVHIPKTGGQSILAACKANIVNHQHMPLSYYRSKFGRDVSFFAFSRNPFDRVVSAYFYLLQGGGSRTDRMDRNKYIGRKTFEEFVLGMPDFYLDQQHIRPQMPYVRGCADNRCIGKFETLDNDFHEFRRHYHIESVPLTKTNASVHPPYQELYTQEMVDVVHELFADDFEYFGYPLALPVAPVAGRIKAAT